MKIADNKHDHDDGGPARLKRRALFAAAGAPALAAVAAGMPAAASAATSADGVPETTLADLRAMTAAPAADLYLVTDAGMEGLFRYDAADTSSPDNTGTVVVSAGGARFKRVFTGPYNVRWFGAKGDGASDDTSAIQSTLDAAFIPRPGENPTSRSGVYLPQGAYQISSPLMLPADPYGIPIFGDGQQQTQIGPRADASFDAIFAFTGSSRTNRPSKFAFRDLWLTGGNRVKYGVYAEQITGSNFRNLNVKYFTEAGIAFGYGWINNIERCTLYHNKDGIRAVDADLNMVNILDCNIDGNTANGISLPRGGEMIRICGCTIENNDICGINLQTQVQGLEISGNYFEHNGASGYAFSNPDRVVRAQIIINGQPDLAAGGTVGTISTTWPTGTVRIANNFAYLRGVAEPTCFVAAYVCYGGLQITENTVDDWADEPGRTDTVVLTGTSKTGLGARVDNLLIRGNGKRWRPKENNVRLEPIVVDDLAGAATSLHEATIEGVVRTNYAPDPVRFAPVSRPMAGKWRESAATYRNRDVFALSGGGEWGFSLDLADYPELAGRYVYLAAWAKAADTSTGPVLSTSQLGPNTAEAAADTGWHIVSYVDKLPDSGSVTFSLSAVGDGTVSFANPVLSEVGVRFDSY